MKELLKKLIQADSTPEKGEIAAAEVISSEFELSGIESHIECWDQNRANIIARVKSTGQKPGLLFACHIDVVGPGETPWQYPVFGGVEQSGRIYGRGSTDMKGGTAAVVTAIRQIVDSGVKLNGDIVFAAVAGEEIDSCGAMKFIDNPGKLPELAGVIIPEPTNFSIVTAHRGMLWLTISTKGKTAHSSTPELGVNAIYSMNHVLDAFQNYEVPVEPHKQLGKCSMSINKISGGKAMNVVPDKCSIGVDFRTLPGQEAKDTIEEMKKILTKLKNEHQNFDAEVSMIRAVRPMETDSNCDFVRNFCQTVNIKETTAVGFTTDGPCFQALGAPVLIFGPGKPELCHKPDEYIDISDVEKGIEYYKNIIMNFLG